MNYRRSRDITKILKRKKMWDYFGWGYYEQINRLNKKHQLKCNCSMCGAMRADKRIRNKKRRLSAHKQINAQLDDL